MVVFLKKSSLCMNPDFQSSPCYISYELLQRFSSEIITDKGRLAYGQTDGQTDEICKKKYIMSRLEKI